MKSAGRCYPWILNCTILHKGNKFQGYQQACFFPHLNLSEIEMPSSPTIPALQPPMVQCMIQQPLSAEWWSQSSCHQFSSVARSYLTLCNPMDCSTPGLLIHHQLPEFTQNHVHWFSDAIQSFHMVAAITYPRNASWLLTYPHCHWVACMVHTTWL